MCVLLFSLIAGEKKKSLVAFFSPRRAALLSPGASPPCRTMLLIASTSLFGMASNGGGLPGVVGQASGDSYRAFTDEPPPCGPGNECNRETLRPERLTTPSQPEPTVIELPTTGSSCKECTRISEDAAAHIDARRWPDARRGARRGRGA